MLRDLGQLSPDHKRGVEAFGLVPGRHANVDNHEVGVLIADDARQLRRVAGSTRDLKHCALEQARHALAHHHA
jgi:hypothetical protein